MVNNGLKRDRKGSDNRLCLTTILTHQGDRYSFNIPIGKSRVVNKELDVTDEPFSQLVIQVSQKLKRID